MIYSYYIAVAQQAVLITQYSKQCSLATTKAERLERKMSIIRKTESSALISDCLAQHQESKAAV